MASDKPRLWIWCEDRAQEQFLRRLFLRVYGLDKRALDIKPAPPGEGSAAHWLAIWVPTWSIETWVKLLSGGFANAPADVETDVKMAFKSHWDRLLPVAISAWNNPPLSSPSLDDARAELARLPLK